MSARRRGPGARCAAAGLLAALMACTQPPAPRAALGAPGTPIADLDAATVARFRAGEVLFNAVFVPATGLGPAFNENQCSACHTDPASGGVGGERITRSAIYAEGAGCDALAAHGGENIRRKLTPAALARGVARERVPEGATVGLFTAPALYGIGFVEAIPDSVLLLRHDPEDRDGDGISGRVGRTPDGRVARFGRKADVATIREFVVSALRNEMGLTSRALPHDLVQGKPAPRDLDSAPDPEVTDDAVALLADYVRLLAPAVRGQPPRPWTAADAQRGERRFASLGCVKCHVPEFTTGPSDVPALDRRTIALYSDLLLHDMGPALADVCSHTATPGEVRTEPLMGLRLRELLLHDGRALAVEDAIRAHGGEAAAARDAFERLTPRQRAELVAFLRTL